MVLPTARGRCKLFACRVSTVVLAAWRFAAPGRATPSGKWFRKQKAILLAERDGYHGA